MKNKRQGMDNFFREKISGFELSEKKSNWELLNHLLNEQERKKKKRKWVFLICFILMLSSGLLVLLADKKLNQDTNNQTELSNTPAASEKNTFKNEREKATTTKPSDKNEIVTWKGNEVQQIRPGNNSSIHEEKNNLPHSVRKEEVNHESVVRKASDESSAAIKPESDFTATQSKIPLTDSDRTVIRETEKAESVTAYPDENDSVTPITITRETAIKIQFLPIHLL